MGAVYFWKNLDKCANEGSKNLVLKVLHGLEVVLMVTEGPKPLLLVLASCSIRSDNHIGSEILHRDLFISCQ